MIITFGNQVIGGQDGFGGQSEPDLLPTDLLGLQWWYDVSQLTGLVNNDPVAVVTDLSGNGRHLTQSNPSSRPTYKVNIENGLPAIQASSGDGFFWTNGKSDINFLHQGASTLIFVIQTLSDNTVCTLLDSSASNNTHVGRTITCTTNLGPGAASDIIRNGSGTVLSGKTTVTGKFPKNETHIMVSRYDGVTFELYIDNVLMGILGTTGSPSGSVATDTPTFLCNTIFGDFFNGYFFEGIAYNRALTNAELNQLIGTASYGIEN